MDVALIQNAEHNVDRDQGGEDEQGLVRERGLKGLGRAGEVGVDRRGDSYLALRRLDDVYRFAQ